MENLIFPSISDLLKIQQKENHERLVIINDNYENIICQYHKTDMENYLGNNIVVRETVAKKLSKVGDELSRINKNYKLKIVYGYRHLVVQVKYFNEQKVKFKRMYPKDTDEELNRRTHMLVANPRVAGHPTGGAVDVTITTPYGDLNMGTKIADFSDIERIQTFSSDISERAHVNRITLHDLMLLEGFAPFYGEWWHFSFGDVEWALFYGLQSSLYSQKKFSLY